MASAAEISVESGVRYSRVAMWFHWIIAVLIVANLVLGLFHEDFARDVRSWMMYIHKGTGMAILALSVARVLWRIGHRPPPFDPVLKAWEVSLAKAIHFLFYAFMIALPITGWMLSSGKGAPIDFFGLFPIPALPVPPTKEAHHLYGEIHEILGKVMIGLILLHVAGALKHHFDGHRHVIGRMSPWLYRQG
jgi:cytochrome b561